MSFEGNLGSTMERDSTSKEVEKSLANTWKILNKHFDTITTCLYPDIIHSINQLLLMSEKYPDMHGKNIKFIDVIFIKYLPL